METEFTPLLSLVGGILIGVSTITLLLLNGRVAGISGILKSVLPPAPDKSKYIESFVFLVGLVVAIPFYQFVTASGVPQIMSQNNILLLVAGLLVGVGVSVGSGCTSGHGVCGISRLSKRSIVATATFMATAAVTVFLIRHVV